MEIHDTKCSLQLGATDLNVMPGPEHPAHEPLHVTLSLTPLHCSNERYAPKIRFQCCNDTPPALLFISIYLDGLSTSR